MNPQEYLNTYNGQSLLYNTKVPSLRGQCVQAVCFFVQNNGFPVLWVETAYEWWTSNQYADRYERIANTANAVPQPGDIIVWKSSLPNSGNAGHIAVCLQPLPGTGTFISVDQNWAGKYVHKVTHNYDYVIGWLRLRRAAPAPSTNAQGADEMIANADQAIKVYKMLRPNGQPSDGEINGTAGKRTFAAFLNDAQAEVAARDSNLRAQNDLIVTLTNQIGQLNGQVAELAKRPTQSALDELQIAMQTCQENAKELVVKTADVAPAPAAKPGDGESWLTRLIAAVMARKKKP